MKSPIVIALSPNAQADDVTLAWRMLWRPWRYQIGSALVDLQSAFEKYFHPGKIFLVNSGRSALYTALRALHLNNDDEVLMQAFTCNAVPNPVLWAGALPRYVDIDPDTLTMSVEDLKAKITPRTKVIIIQHTFGYPANVQEIITIARQYNCVVIEDCAHALSGLLAQAKLGTMADMAIFSFGRDKVISSVYGGCLLVNSPEFFSPVQDLYSQIPMPSRRWVMQQLFHPLIFKTGLRYYTVGSLGKILLGLSSKLRLISKAVSTEEKRGEKPKMFPGKLPNAQAQLALQQFNKLETMRRHRKKIAKLYSTHLCSPHITHTQSNDGIIVEPAYLRYTILVDQPQALRVFAKQRGVMLGDWYDCPVAPRGTSQLAVHYQSGTCPQAEYIAAHAVNLPTHINISVANAQYIIDTINSYLKTISTT